MNPRRYSQIERALSILDKSVTVDLLKEDQYVLFLFKKAERIIAGLYIITSSFSDAEPLKWGIRESGTFLLKHILSLKERAVQSSKEFLSDTLTEMAHLSSLLDLASIADLLSPMNFSVLKKELENVRGIIEGKWRISGLPISPPFLEKSFFAIPKDIFADAGEEKSNDIITPSHRMEQKTQQNAEFYGFGEFERFRKDQKDISKGHGEIKDSVLNRKTRISTLKTRVTSADKSFIRPLQNQAKEDRKQNILSVLHKQDTAMIKDFSTVIRGCSEKTIQRLLLEMVRQNVLKREGDRRWSRYSIVQREKVV